MSKNGIINLAVILLGCFVLSLCCCIAYKMGADRAKRIAVNFETSDRHAEEPHKYQFLDKSISDYICSLSAELGIDSNLVVAILMVENPEFNADAVHRNANGTIDCGLFQLNDRYIWTSFKDSYWFENLDLDPFNWKHSAYLAMHHIAYLQTKLKVTDEVVMAYNCGAAAVMSDRIPDTTRAYLRKVNTNLFLLNERTQ